MRASGRALVALFVLLVSIPAFGQSAQSSQANLTSATCPGTGCLSVAAAGYGTVGFQLSGTFSGTLSFEGTTDNSNWVALRATPPGTTTAVTSATAAGAWVGSAAGLSQVRARVSSYTSGSFSVSILVTETGGGAGGGGAGAAGVVTIESAGVASGAFASGSIASGAVASGAIASGAVASGAVASGAFASGALASGSVSNGAIVTLGAMADAKSTATDTTAITLMQVAKQISASVQVGATAAAQTTAQTSLSNLETSLTALTTNNTQKRFISAGSTEDETQVKATAGVLAGFSCTNAHASTNAFIKFTNLTAANTTPGSSAIFYSAMIPFGAGIVDRNIEVAFDTALTFYVVTGKAENDVAEVAATDIACNVAYR